MDQINQTTKLKLGKIVCSLVAGLLMVACDTLQKDTIPDDTITISNNVIYLTPKSSGIIDLQSMVQALKTVKISTGQPKSGSLDPLNGTLLKYTPHAGFQGTDGFRVSFYTSSNEFIKNDSLTIIFKSDSVGLPCGLWAQNDYVSGVKTSIEVDVLKNDITCGIDSSTLKITVLNIQNNGVLTQPAFGTAELLANGKIRYTAGPSFSGNDSFVYRLEKPADVPHTGDAASVSYGVVSIVGATVTCKSPLILNDDEFDYTLSTLNRSDTIFFYPTRNDSICLQGATNFSIGIYSPANGHVFVINNEPFPFRYLLPPNVTNGFVDKFKYGICVDNVCKQAEIKLVFN